MHMHHQSRKSPSLDHLPSSNTHTYPFTSPLLSFHWLYPSRCFHTISFCNPPPSFFCHYSCVSAVSLSQSSQIEPKQRVYREDSLASLPAVIPLVSSLASILFHHSRCFSKRVQSNEAMKCAYWFFSHWFSFIWLNWVGAHPAAFFLERNNWILFTKMQSEFIRYWNLELMFSGLKTHSF